MRRRRWQRCTLWSLDLFGDATFNATPSPVHRHNEPGMTLAPIRGAPPGASIPDFPVKDPTAELLPMTADDQHHLLPARQPHAPIEISGDGVALMFKVIPEQPAISRASMTIHVIAHVDGSVSHTVGLLKMSATNARRFLTDLRNRRSPIIAKGDEGGTVEIEYELTGMHHVFLVHILGERHIMCRVLRDVNCGIEAAANDLLADLGL
jgi:hypothetical protein